MVEEYYRSHKPLIGHYLMPAIPLPFLVSTLILVIFAVMLRESRDEPRNRAFLALILMSALQSLLLGLRWGYEVDEVRYILPVIAMLTPPLVYSGVSEFVHRRPPFGIKQLTIYGVPPTIVIVLLFVAPSAIDLAVVAVFVGYAVAVLRLIWPGVDSLDQAPLEGAVQIYRAVSLAAGALLFSAFIDTMVYLDFLFDQGRSSVEWVSFGNLGVLFILGLAAAAASRGQPANEPRGLAPESDVDVEATETMNRINTLMRERTLYRDAELNLDRLARKAMIPARHISQAVNTIAGQNVSQYVNGFRIAEACELLEETRKPVTEIMFDVGFQTKSNFNREFRRVVGVTPMDWRASRKNKS
jgi:AraC-like DNA-binding protein